MFNICCNRGFSIVMEWITTRLIFSAACAIPMTGAFRRTHFKAFDLVWGPHSNDRFAFYLHTKHLRFNSRFRIQARKELNHFFMDWAGENNFVCSYSASVIVRRQKLLLLLCATQLLFGS